MSWIHCNNCFIRKNKELKMYCTSCCHILCKKCLKSPCPICNGKYKIVEIGSSMPEEVRLCFEDPLKLMKTFQKAAKFQSEHKSRYEEKMCNVFAELSKEKQERDKLKAGLHLVEQEIEKEKAKLLKIKAFAEKHSKYSSLVNNNKRTLSPANNSPSNNSSLNSTKLNLSHLSMNKNNALSSTPLGIYTSSFQTPDRSSTFNFKNSTLGTGTFKPFDSSTDTGYNTESVKQKKKSMLDNSYFNFSDL